MVRSFFDEALAEVRLSSLYRESSVGLDRVLVSNGWVELSIELGPADLRLVYEYLAFVLPALERSVSMPGGVVLKSPILHTPPSYLQFFFDLFSLAESDTPYNEVLVSYLHLEDTGLQSYELYDCDSVSSIEYLLSSIKDSPALIFPGRFQFSQGGSGLILNTRRANQRTVNGICVDIDPFINSSVDLPIDPVVLSELLSRVDSRLRPSYVCLTGRGLHLWYIFDKPVQTFRARNPRRIKLQALSRALYSYFATILKDLPCVLDHRCAAINHGFRAPGSLSKRGYPVRVYCPSDFVNRHSVVSPLEISDVLSSLSETMGFEYPEDSRLFADDVRWKSFSDMRTELALLRSRPATDSQLEFISNLHDSGWVTDQEFSRCISICAPQAGELIGRALERRNLSRSRSNKLPIRPSWRTRPHSVIAGKSGGIYRVVLENIQKVPLGRRYLSLHMLAGVAYMMVDPIKTKAELESDLTALLDTKWAKMGTPLTLRDVRNALLGYTPENWQTRNSICSILGFDPFGDPPKRNGRSRADHLAHVANPARSAKMKKSALDAIIKCLKADPGASKRAISLTSGVSYTTVSKYWVEACDILGIEDCRSRYHGPRNNIE